jgi:hypothetical protein
VEPRWGSRFAFGAYDPGYAAKRRLPWALVLNAVGVRTQGVLLRVLLCGFLSRDTIRRMFRRFRFSMRWMLIAFTVLSFGFYLFFIRPTVLANRFVAAVESGKHELDPSIQLAATSFGKKPVFRYTSAYLLHREWSDVWECQHRVMATAITKGPMRIDVEIAAGPFRLSPTGRHGTKTDLY